MVEAESMCIQGDGKEDTVCFSYSHSVGQQNFLLLTTICLPLLLFLKIQDDEM